MTVPSVRGKNKGSPAIPKDSKSQWKSKGGWTDNTDRITLPGNAADNQ